MGGSPGRGRHARQGALAALLLAAGPAAAAVSMFPEGSTLRLGVAAPVTFAPGPDGETTLSADGTRALTTLALRGKPPATDPAVLQIESRSLSAMRVALALDPASDPGRVRTAEVLLGGVAQVRIVDGQALEPRGPFLLLPPGGTLTAGATVRIQGGPEAALSILVLSGPTVAPGIEASQSWTILAGRG